MILTLQQETQLFKALRYALAQSDDQDVECPGVVPVKVPMVIRELVGIEIGFSSVSFNPTALAALIRIWNIIASLLDKPGFVNDYERLAKGTHPDFLMLASEFAQDDSVEVAPKPLEVADLIHALTKPMDGDQLDDYFDMACDLCFGMAHYYFGLSLSAFQEGLFLQHLLALSSQVNEQIIRNRLFS